MTADPHIAAPGRASPPTDWLEAAVRGLPVGVVVAEKADRCVRYANEAVSRILGIEVSVGQALGAEPVAMRRLSGEPIPLDELPLLRALDRGESVRDEPVVWRVPGGAEKTLETTAEPIRDADGRVVAAVVIFQDVTDRERRERAARDFVTNAAHELQTPLTAITSAVEVLQAGAKEVAEDRDRFLAHVQTETHRLGRLAHALLLLARIEVAGEVARRERVLLRPLLDGVALSLQPADGVEVRVRCPATLAALADPPLLEQALLNVAGNAAKHTGSGSILLSARRTGDRVTLEVADTGPGVPAGEEDAVFDRFYRGGGRDRAGFGLGLAIARQAVHALGGEIELGRRSTQGTLVRITLAAAKA